MDLGGIIRILIRPYKNSRNFFFQYLINKIDEQNFNSFEKNFRLIT